MVIDHHFFNIYYKYSKCSYITPFAKNVPSAEPRVVPLRSLLYFNSWTPVILSPCSYLVFNLKSQANYM